MGWFTKFCRQTGLMIHHIIRPAADGHRTILNRVDERRDPDPSVTLRRTTIEEVEVRNNKPNGT